VQRWLGELALALRHETYRPDPIRRVFIPKANERTRVALAQAKLRGVKLGLNILRVAATPVAGAAALSRPANAANGDDERWLSILSPLIEPLAASDGRHSTGLADPAATGQQQRRVRLSAG
jgi:hypothetical protein